MAERDSFPWTALLLILVGAWLVLQTLAGQLPQRIMSWAGAPAGTKGRPGTDASNGQSGLDPKPGSGGGGGAASGGVGGGGGGSW